MMGRSLLLSILLGLSWARGDSAVHRLTILHTNDLEGRLQAREAEDGLPGGFAHLLALLDQERGRADDVILLDGGDAFGASSLASFDSGALVGQLMAHAGYDAMVTGNHEFDYGLDSLRSLTQRLPFPLLAANVHTATDSTLEPWTLLERNGLRIAVFGLLSPTTAKLINPLHNPGLKVVDPIAVMDSLAPIMRASSDCLIGLLHMEEAEALALAQRFTDVDLFIAGGFRRADSQAAYLHQIRLAGGAHLLSTPAGGTHIGKIEWQWTQRDTHWTQRSFSAHLLPIDGDAGAHDQARTAIDQLQRRFDESGRAVLGNVHQPVEDAPAWVAALMRQKTGSEVGVVNRGAINALALADSVTAAQVRRLVRYDDFVVTLELSGKQLADLAAQSKMRTKTNQQLAFAGYDITSGRVNGRMLNAEERYRVSTTAYLAEGGDAYLQARDLIYGSGNQPKLKEIIVAALSESHTHPSPAYAPVWKGSFQLNGALSWTGIGDAASDYSDISFLSGRSALAWNGLFDGKLTREVPNGRLEHQVRSNYGQVRNSGRFRESSDRLQADLTYTRQTRTPAPFAALAANTVWSSEDTAQRPLTLRASAGIHQPLSQLVTVRLGLGWERDVAAGENDLGIEMLPEFKITWKDNRLASSCKLFVGASKARTLSLQQYNSMSVHLGGNLNLSLDANFFAHRSSAVGTTGFKSELQIGLGYSWSEKWF